MKKTWKIVEEIPQNTIFMTGYPCKGFFDWPKHGLGDKLSEYFTYHQGDFSQMVYIADEFDQQAEFLANKVINEPDWTLDFLNNIIIWSDQLLKEVKRIETWNFSKMSNKDIYRKLNNLFKIHYKQHSLSPSITWHADAEKERVTKAIKKIVDGARKRSKVKKSLIDVFTVLSTPTKVSVMEREEESFLNIALVLDNKTKLKETFIQSDLDELVDGLSSIDKEVSELIIKHFNIFSPMTYQYRGPAYPISDYIGRLQAFMREGLDARVLLKKLEAKRKREKLEQLGLIKRIKLTSLEKKYIKIAQEMMYVKDYRKSVLYTTMYYYELIFKELGKRFNLTIDQVRAMRYWEILEMVKSGQVKADMLNDRLKLALDYWYVQDDKVNNKVLIGSEAKKFLKNLKFQVKKKVSNELKGTCAYPGKVKGTIKVISVPKDMPKMKEGDIMVSHNTNPSLVPAMKKASALVSGAGGLTCHTSIVARELKVPCVVGILGCNKILKDGDKVEADAAKGMIKKI